MKFRRGEHMNIEHLEDSCPNHWTGRKGYSPDMICMHIVEGSVASAVNWFQNPSSQVSSHFIIGKDGRIVQMVKLSDGAWCNGDRKNPTAKLVINREGINPNSYTYSIEHEGYSYKDGSGALTEKQYQATLHVCKLIIDDMKNSYGINFIIDRDHLIGHYEINSIDKINCPGLDKGKNFPFDRLLADLKVWKEPYPFEINEEVYALEAVILEETAGYDSSTTYLLPKGSFAIVNKYHEINGRYMALKNEHNEYFKAAWTKEFTKFSKEKPTEPIPDSEDDNNQNDEEDNNDNNGVPSNNNVPHQKVCTFTTIFKFIGSLFQKIFKRK